MGCCGAKNWPDDDVIGGEILCQLQHDISSHHEGEAFDLAHVVAVDG